MTTPPREDLIWLAVDLDSTLASPLPLEEVLGGAIGPPIRENVEKARRAHQAGWKIVIHTARGWAEYERIEAWLKEFNIPFRTIVCGKILAHSYVDDRAVPAWFKEWTWTHQEAEEYYTHLEQQAGYEELAETYFD